MDPISIIIEFEIATMLLAGVGAVATWLHNKRSEREHLQREMHHQDMKALHERHHKARQRTENREAESDMMETALVENLVETILSEKS